MREVETKSVFYRQLTRMLHDGHVSKAERNKILVNMERCRWRMSDTPESHEKYVLVNIPSYHLLAVDGKKWLTMRTAFGAVSYTHLDGGFMNVNRIGYFKNVNIIGQRDFAYPYTANLYDLLDHGTMVLSDIGANVDSLFVGTAPHASFLLLRSEDGDHESLVEEDYWAQAVEYADSVGADVINSSLGYSKFDDKSTKDVYKRQHSYQS